MSYAIFSVLKHFSLPSNNKRRSFSNAQAVIANRSWFSLEIKGWQTVKRCWSCVRTFPTLHVFLKKNVATSQFNQRPTRLFICFPPEIRSVKERRILMGYPHGCACCQWAIRTTFNLWRFRHDNWLFTLLCEGYLASVICVANYKMSASSELAWLREIPERKGKKKLKIGTEHRCFEKAPSPSARFLEYGKAHYPRILCQGHVVISLYPEYSSTYFLERRILLMPYDGSPGQ